jgi:hypothetical protein
MDKNLNRSKKKSRACVSLITCIILTNIAGGIFVYPVGILPVTMPAGTGGRGETAVSTNIRRRITSEPTTIEAIERCMWMHTATACGSLRAWPVPAGPPLGKNMRPNLSSYLTARHENSLMRQQVAVDCDPGHLRCGSPLHGYHEIARRIAPEVLTLRVGLAYGWYNYCTCLKLLDQFFL